MKSVPIAGVKCVIEKGQDSKWREQVVADGREQIESREFAAGQRRVKNREYGAGRRGKGQGIFKAGLKPEKLGTA